MSVRAQCGLANTPQQLEKVWVVNKTRPQHEAVYKETDQPFGLGAIAICNRRADNDIHLPRIAMQQALERRQQHHEQGRAFLLS